MTKETIRGGDRDRWAQESRARAVRFGSKVVQEPRESASARRTRVPKKRARARSTFGRDSCQTSPPGPRGRRATSAAVTPQPKNLIGARETPITAPRGPIISHAWDGRTPPEA